MLTMATNSSVAVGRSRCRGLEDQPGRAEQGVAGGQPEAANDGKGGEEIVGPAVKRATLDRNAGDEAAEHHPLTQRSEQRAAAERPIPHIPEAAGAEAEL